MPTGVTACGPIELSREALDAFVAGLRDHDRAVGMSCADTARALVLYRARGSAGEAGRQYFDLDGDVDEGAAWGLRRGARPPQEIITELSRLIALVGPTVVAVDQLDSLMVQSRRVDGVASEVPLGLVNQVADGLMELREMTRRTLPVVACIHDTWELIRTRGVASAAERYTVTILREELPRAQVAAELVRAHLASRYLEIGFKPPYPTWPVQPRAFTTAERHTTPRRVLAHVGRHLRRCLESDEVVELDSFSDTLSAPQPRLVPSVALAELDQAFDRLRRSAVVDPAVSSDTEDEVMPGVLHAGLQSYILELGEEGASF